MVSFGLPGPLSFRVAEHAMVAADRGQTPTGKRQGQAAKRPDPPSQGNGMPAKKTPQKARRRKSKTRPASAHAASMVSMAVQNLINMVVVTAISGTVLLGLLAARHF
jgi:ABC-type uncharacterized transport system involved in gliding motility auxiliary subunit